MSSLTDIPNDLLKPEAKIEFIGWLNLYPMADSAKRKYISLWITTTGSTFTKADYEYSGLYFNA